MLEACRYYVQERVFPLLYVTGEKSAVVLGTGFLVEDREDTFLVTAAHVLETEDGTLYDHIAFPLRGPEEDVYALPESLYISGSEVGADVAVVQLNYDSDIQRSLHWKAVQLDSFYDHGEVDSEQTILVYGYPAALQQDIEADSLVGLGVVGFKTKPFGGDFSVVDNYRPDIEIIFDYTSHMTVDGVEKSVPDLHGISGSAMFCIDHTVGGVWSAERCLKIVGVQKAVKPGRYIKATRSTCLKVSLAKLFAEIRQGE